MVVFLPSFPNFPSRLDNAVRICSRYELVKNHWISLKGLVGKPVGMSGVFEERSGLEEGLEDMMMERDSNLG